MIERKLRDVCKRWLRDEVKDWFRMAKDYWWYDVMIIGIQNDQKLCIFCTSVQQACAQSGRSLHFFYLCWGYRLNMYVVQWFSGCKQATEQIFLLQHCFRDNMYHQKCVPESFIYLPIFSFYSKAKRNKRFFASVLFRNEDNGAPYTQQLSLPDSHS